MRSLYLLLLLCFSFLYVPLSGTTPQYKWAKIVSNKNDLPIRHHKRDGSKIHIKRDPQGYIQSIAAPGLDYSYEYDKHGKISRATQVGSSFQTRQIRDKSGLLVRDTISPKVEVLYRKNGDALVIEIVGHALLRYVKAGDFVMLERHRLTKDSDPLDEKFFLSSPLYKKRIHADLIPYDVEDEPYPTVFNAAGNPEDSFVNEYNEVLEYGDISCDYDLNGNLTNKRNADGLWQYFYDPFNRLILAINEEKDLSISYSYDALGRRIKKTVLQNDKKIACDHYIFLDQHEIGVIDKQGHLRELRVPLDPLNPTTLIPIAIELKGKSYHVETDRIGRVHKLTDMRSCIEYDYYISAFGQNATSSHNAPFCPWIFASKRYDKETGLFYFGHRYYDKELLRFTTPDPLGNFLGPNVYAYCQFDPLHYTDLDGRLALPILAISWGAGATVTLPATAAIASAIATCWIAKKGYDWYTRKSSSTSFPDSFSQTSFELPSKNSYLDDPRFMEIADALTDIAGELLNTHYSAYQKAFPDPNKNKFYSSGKFSSSPKQIPTEKPVETPIESSPPKIEDLLPVFQKVSTDESFPSDIHPLYITDYSNPLSTSSNIAKESSASRPSIIQCRLAFEVGVIKGVCKAGIDVANLAKELTFHPIDTSLQLSKHLADAGLLIATGKFSQLREDLFPEWHNLIQDWNNLTPDERSLQIGYACGKTFGDLLTAKGAGKTLKLLKQKKRLHIEKLSYAELDMLETLESTLNTTLDTLKEKTKSPAPPPTKSYTTPSSHSLKSTIVSEKNKFISPSESKVLQKAIQQDKHVKMVKIYLSRSTKEIQKSIRSYDKQIAKHKNKIKNPSQFIPHWDKLHPERREALLNKKWPAEIQCHTEQKEILQAILKERIR